MCSKLFEIINTLETKNLSPFKLRQAATAICPKWNIRLTKWKISRVGCQFLYLTCFLLTSAVQPFVAVCVQGLGPQLVQLTISFAPVAPPVVAPPSRFFLPCDRVSVEETYILNNNVLFKQRSTLSIRSLSTLPPSGFPNLPSGNDPRTCPRF